MDKPRAVTRPKEFDEQIAFLAAEGTRARVEAARGGMSKADFLRWCVDRGVAEKLAREGSDGEQSGVTRTQLGRRLD